MKQLLIFFLFLLLIFLFFFLFFKLSQNKQIFFPVENIETTPEDFDLPFKDLYIKTVDGLKLNGWFIPDEESSLTLLFLHGNGGNISHRLDKVSQLHQLGLNIFIVDYRGYGKSQGAPSVSGVYKDAQASLDYLVDEKEISSEKIVVYGESLGSALAVGLASGNEVGGIILEGVFSSGKDMAKLIYPYLPSFLLPNIFEVSKDIEKVDEPKLFIHSKVDEIVPIRLAKKLYKKASKPKEFIEVIGGHNTSYIDANDSYLSGIKSFLEKIKNNDYKQGKNNE